MNAAGIALLLILLPSPDLSAAIERARQLPRVRSLLVQWRGATVLERYFNGATANRPGNVKSVSKSVISALVGVAIDQGRIRSVKEPIGPVFAEFLPGEKNAARRAITVEDLLTMRSGLETTSNRNYGAWVRSGNWVRHALTRPMTYTPGDVMEYSTGNTHVLSAMLTRAVGKSTWRFAQEVLARPLGFTLAPWPQDPQGVFFGGNDMLLTPRQLLAFGELYLRKGRHNGHQVIPEWWVEASLRPLAQSRRESDRYYGYGWWIRDLGGHRVFYAWGFGGQYVFVVPTLDLVVVTTSASTVSEDRRSHRAAVYDLVERDIIGAIAEFAAASN